MLILIEGVDGSGKSTLCKQLEEKGYQIYRDERDFDIQRKTKVFNMWTSPIKYVCDRSFLTDIVYRTVYGGKHGPIEFRQAISMLDQVYRERSCKIVYCCSGTEFEDSMARGEDNVKTKQESVIIKQCYEVFIAVCREWLKTPVYNYNWKSDNVSNVINFIEGGIYEPRAVQHD